VVAKTTLGDDMVTLTVEKDSRNRIEIGPDGVGTLTAVVSRQISDKQWGGLIPYFILVRLPVTRTADDCIHINMNGATMATITRRTPFAVTDYNGDGVRDHTLDYTTLLADFAQQAGRADMNRDGSWTQADLDMWENLYQADYDAQ
jgi:hypothetical protein